MEPSSVKMLVKNEIIIFGLALQFLTRLPVPVSIAYTEHRFAKSVRYYPLVGVVVGSLVAIACYLASLIFPLSIAVMLSMVFSLLLTGGFHEDGLADTFDGIGGGQTAESALDIMKDSRLGTYGTLALVMMLLAKYLSLSEMPLHLVVAALVAAHGLSRLSSVIVIATSQYVRPSGTAKPVAGAIDSRGLQLSIGTGVVIVVVSSLFIPVITLSLALAGLVIGHVLMRWFVQRKIKGFSGDTLGAVQQCSEIGFYLGMLVAVS